MQHAQTSVNKICTASKPEDFLDLFLVEEALIVNVSFKLNRIMALKKESKAPKIDFTNSINGLDMVDIGGTHIKFL